MILLKDLFCPGSPTQFREELIEEELGDVEYNSEKLWETIEKVCSSKKNYRKFALFNKLFFPAVTKPFDHHKLISDIKTTNQLLQKIGIIINDDLLPFIVIKNLPEELLFFGKTS
jgi:hypothetical protein